MKNRLILMLLALSVHFISSAQSQFFNPRTGDAELDGILKDIDKNAKKNLDFFAKDVVAKFNVPKPSIDKVIKIMPPGDIFMAAQLSLTLSKPFDIVVSNYNLHKSQGWGVTAKEMGIKPGSSEFHEMKKALKGNVKTRIRKADMVGNNSANPAKAENVKTGKGNPSNGNLNGKGRKK
jgi:hypothetical protein